MSKDNSNARPIDAPGIVAQGDGQDKDHKISRLQEEIGHRIATCQRNIGHGQGERLQVHGQYGQLRHPYNRQEVAAEQ